MPNFIQSPSELIEEERRGSSVQELARESEGVSSRHATTNKYVPVVLLQEGAGHFSLAALSSIFLLLYEMIMAAASGSARPGKVPYYRAELMAYRHLL